jgi:hypothetical protein
MAGLPSALHSKVSCKFFQRSFDIHAVALVLSDSDITVRRKIVFLINSLLVPTFPDTTQSQTTIHSHQAVPVHPNSHASMLSDPNSTETSPATMKALHEHGILTALISALIAPTPHGADGESDGDVDFEEKVIRSVMIAVLVFCFILFVTSDCYTRMHSSAMVSFQRRRNLSFACFSTNSSEWRAGRRVFVRGGG